MTVGEGEGLGMGRINRWLYWFITRTPAEKFSQLTMTAILVILVLSCLLACILTVLVQR